MSYYETLGVDSSATMDEIKKAYRKLSKQHHPDVNGGDDAKFKEIAEAYEHLSSDVKRAQYDASRMNPFGNMGANGFSFDGNFSDMFNQFFGGDPRTMRGQNHTVIANISFKDAYTGAEKLFNIGGETIKLHIPIGVKNGTKLRIAGKGQINPYNPSAGRGDLIIQIQIQQDSQFILQGDDIWIEQSLPWWDIISGTKLNVWLPDGTQIKVTVSPNSFNGKTLRVKGKGYPIYNTTQRGELMIRLNATFPELDQESINKVNEIKEHISGLGQ
jgi:curved DNA-binding protein